MISIFNRKELIVTFRMEQYSCYKDILNENNIEYSVKVVNRSSPSIFGLGNRGRMGSLGEKMDSTYEYIIYVKKQDYEAALGLLKQK